MTMMRNFARFNIYLAAVLALALVTVTGCQTGKKKDKDKAVIQLHQEAYTSGASDTERVAIYRENPIYVNVDKEPFIDSADITEAKVLEDLGGFVIQLRFNWRGSQILNGVTTANRDKRIAVHCIFNKEARWLASPVIRKPLRDGIFTFTPDCTRAEADHIVKGLNAEAAALKEKDSF